MTNISPKDLQKFYLAYFGRPGDPSGIKYWISSSDESLTLREISREFSRQDEYENYITNDKSIESQINRLYINLFDRKSDFDGLNYWIKLVNNKDYQFYEVVYDLIFSNHKPYSINPSQEKKDLRILENKVFAAENFTDQISKSFTLIN